MKKQLLLLLVPLLLAFQCNEEELIGFETNYILQNDTANDLFYLSENDNFIAVKNQSRFSIGSSLNPVTSPISPTESGLFSTIKLYELNGSDYILVFSQDPIDDASWAFSEPKTNRFEYRLVITNTELD